jgi:hypothetical protein
MLGNNRFVPMFFDPDISDGRGKLTEAGKKALQEEMDMVDHAPAAAAVAPGSS